MTDEEIVIVGEVVVEAGIAKSVKEDATGIEIAIVTVGTVIEIATEIVTENAVAAGKSQLKSNLKKTKMQKERNDDVNARETATVTADVTETVIATVTDETVTDVTGIVVIAYRSRRNKMTGMEIWNKILLT